MEPSDEDRRRLVGDLLQRSRYRRGLQQRSDEVIRVVLANRQLRGAVDAILADRDYSSLGRIDRRRLGHQKALIDHMLEWAYFASDEFVERARRG
ncbi:MAG: hypothetical protein RIB84_21240 [Sneathiellaceae bacterium]